MCHYLSFVVANDSKNGGFIVLGEPGMVSHDEIRDCHRVVYDSVMQSKKRLWVECEWREDGIHNLEVRTLDENTRDKVKDFVASNWSSRDALVYRLSMDMLRNRVIPDITCLLSKDKSIEIVCKIILLILEESPPKLIDEDIQYLKEIVNQIMSGNYPEGAFNRIHSMYIDNVFPHDQIPFILKNMFLPKYPPYFSREYIFFREYITGLIRYTSSKKRAFVRKYVVDLIKDYMTENAKVKKGE